MLPCVALANPSGVAALQGVQTELLLLMCEVDDGGPLELGSSPTRIRAGSSALAYHYGAVLGNVLVLWCGAAVVAAAAVAVCAYTSNHHRIDMRKSMDALRLPGRLLNVYVPLLQPTMASTVAIAAAAVRAPLGVACTVIGFVSCVVPSCAVALVVTRRFGATPSAREELPEGPEGGLLARLKAAKEFLLHEDTEYEDATPRSGFVGMYSKLFADYRAGWHWFGVVELACELLLGVIRGTVPTAAQRGSCTVPTVAAAAVAGAALLVMGLCRPHNTVLDLIVGCLEKGLLLTGCVLILTVGGRATAEFLVAQMYVEIVTALLRVPSLFSRCCRYRSSPPRSYSRVLRDPRRAKALSKSANERLSVLIQMVCTARLELPCATSAGDSDPVPSRHRRPTPTPDGTLPGRGEQGSLGFGRGY
jgi:hypothetical protein